MKRGRAALLLACHAAFPIVSHSKSTPRLYSGRDVTPLPCIFAYSQKAYLELRSRLEAKKGEALEHWTGATVME